MTTDILLVLTLLCAVIISILVLKNKDNPGSTGLLFFCASLSLSVLANYLGQHASPRFQITWFAIFFLGLRLAYTAILLFVLQFTQHSNWVKPFRLAFLVIEPLVSQLLFWVSQQKLFFSLDLDPGITKSFTYGNAWLLVNPIYITFLLTLALYLLLRDFSYRPLTYRYQARFILAGIIAALLINNNFSGFNFFSTQDMKLIGLLISSLAMIPGFIFAGITEITPIARASVVEHMRDGWMVLDKDNKVIDINLAAEKIIGIPVGKLSGKPAEEIFVDWPNIMYNLNDTREIDLKGSVKLDEAWIYLNIHISPLADKQKNLVGKLIVWRNITDRRIADEARQQARDEMFILLHSITSAASRAINLDDFLAESIYQIVYSSRSQSISVYLKEDHDNSSRDPHLVLAAQHGVPHELGDSMDSIPESHHLIAELFAKGDYLLIPDIQQDARIPHAMQNLGPLTFLLMPMTVDGAPLGLIALTRSDGSIYSPEEITRLAAVTDEVASFVLSNRQRQLSIALAERQRLLRDLHDSITQKLYGLVTLAEATQAGIQAGVTDMPARVIGRMAENARQALKEMRLFLFQLQPIDFERDGLVSVIQQRLSAVEGRANIFARLVSDDKISLPLEKELAIYYIAQEALNNILKHANAKNIKVTLKNTASHFNLLVEDDGVGFNTKSANKDGIGLKSMRERTALIGGKIKISSVPGTGTKIAVTLKNIRRMDD